MRTAQKVLGDKLIGMQVGNEPDLYANRRRGPVRTRMLCSASPLSMLNRAIPKTTTLENLETLSNVSLTTPRFQLRTGLSGLASPSTSTRF